MDNKPNHTIVEEHASSIEYTIDEARGRGFVSRYSGQQTGPLEYSPESDAARQEEAGGSKPGRQIDHGRSRSGVPVSGADLDDNSIIKLAGGIETTVKAAKAAGMVTRNHDGSLTDNSGSEAADDGSEGQQDDIPEALRPDGERTTLPDQTAENLANSLEEMAHPGHLDQAVKEIADTIGAFGKDGRPMPAEPSQRVLKEIQAATGFTPADTTATMHYLMDAYQNQANNHVQQTYGFEPTDVWSWANENALDLVRSAIRKQAGSSRSLSGYDEVVRV